ncbi:hypothetical protein NP493_15g00024 [Ridgeia piscesae]|uniref:FAS1 domain-containing protein n=1 Tax=Ridgeia piscesae TaxID=27915 RepID=A0AAD9UKW9_RIDPI|nr:hypothetical protein NP493_15g00024 [Ridgeia piscesae]
MRNLPLMLEFGALGEKKYTFFAPSNEAFENIPSRVSQHYQLTSNIVRKEKDDIMRYHTVLAELKTAEMVKNETVKTYDTDANLFIYVSNKGERFVNGAKLEGEEIIASNGVIHIINTLMYERGQSVNAYSYITTVGTQLSNPSERTTSEFNKLLTRYLENERTQHAGHFNARDELRGGHSKTVTVFVPSDDAIANIPQQQLTLLKADSTQLKKVIEGHLILGGVYHTDLLLRPEFNDLVAMDGRIVVKKFLGKVYVSNTCAQGLVTHGNITVSNGVVHIVDGLLGYVYSDAITLLHDQRKYQWFYSHVKTATAIANMLTLPRGTTVVPESRMYSVFAPVGVTGLDLTQDIDKLDSVMRMHVIKGRIEISDMKNNTKRVTMNSDQTATFYQVDDAVFIEVNYVRARITHGDICVKNGILHNIDAVLGVPVETIATAISANTKQLLSLLKSVRNTGLWTYLNDRTKRVTMFAPVDKAFQSMLDDSLGRKLLDPRYERNLKLLLERHIITEEVFLDTITDSKTFKTKLGDDIEITKEGSEYHVRFGSNVVGVIQSNMRMTNGVLHLIDGVLYSDDPSTGEWVSRAPVTSQCYILLALLSSYITSLTEYDDVITPTVLMSTKCLIQNRI